MSNPWPRCPPCTEHQLTMECEGPVKVSTIESTKNPHLNLYVYHPTTDIIFEIDLHYLLYLLCKHPVHNCTHHTIPTRSYKYKSSTDLPIPCIIYPHSTDIIHSSENQYTIVYLQIRPVHFRQGLAPSKRHATSTKRVSKMPETILL